MIFLDKLVHVLFGKMCGSLLSKFKNNKNTVGPSKIVFPGQREVRSQTKRPTEDSACHEDRGFWKDGDQPDKSSRHSFVASPSKTSFTNGCPSESDCQPKQVEDTLSVLVCTKPVLPAINSINVTMPPAARNSNHLLESAREILAFHASSTSSSCDTGTAQPLSSINSTLPKMKTAVAFDIPTTRKETLCPSARVPWRLRKRAKVAPEPTLEDLEGRMRSAEKRKMKELERIRASARSGIGVSRPHPADVSAQKTKEKIAAKQAAAERKRNEEIEKRKEAGNRASRSRNRIAAARVFAKTQLESSIDRKMDETQQRKVRKQQAVDKQKKLKEKYAKKVKDRVSIFSFITLHQ